MLIRILGAMVKRRTALRRFALAGLLAGLAATLPTPTAAEGERDVRRNLVVRVVEKARPAIVSIRTNQIVTRTWYDIWNRPLHTEPYERDGGLGSGAIFHPDGYVITNAHVISRASKIFVGLSTSPNGDEETSQHLALPMAIDIANDLAILRLLPEPGEEVRKYPFLRLGTSSDLMVGEDVIAMGHPFRLGLTATRGIVSGLDRKLVLRSQTFDDFMQVDAAINPGNSGGPLFDITGRWIGVNTAIYNRAFGAEGIGFAIPANRVRSLIAAAFKRRVVTDDWLGVEFKEGSTGEAVVDRVYPKGPARRTGLEPDDVVVSVNGRTTPTLYDLRMTLVAERGRTIELGLRRAGERDAFGVGVALQPVPTDTLSAQHFGFLAEDTGERNGVVVTRIIAGGAAEGMLMRKGDVIFGLGHWEVRNTEDLLMFLQFVAAGDLVDVKIRRPAGRGSFDLEGSMRAK
jgi:serine protease Do